ncbi:MAG: ABC transporter substrate-binding protein [Natronohydrobacter sp.]|nr:ABC transporter substrate-binding protein [Natronohydrobacter sp.]
MAAVALAVPAGAVKAQESVTIASWGGAYQEAQRNALFTPGSAATGISVVEETFGGMSDVRLRVLAGAIAWDIVSSGSGSAARAAEEGLLEALDYSVIDVSDFAPGFYTDTCVGSDVFSTVLAWNTATYGDNGPQSWADFWDVERFPGTRAYRARVAGALEPALMADGVPPSEVYAVLSTPEGIERALNKIRELRPHISVWWESGAQHAQLMKDGEVDMTTGWNGRFDAAREDGAQVAYTFNQGLLDYDCFAIPRGAPNKDAAMRFLAEISKPELQANIPTYISYGPTNLAAFDLELIPDELARTLPSYPDNASVQLPVNIEWYGKFEQEAAALYQDMMTE